MKFDLSKPILYLITRGASTEKTTPGSSEFEQVLAQIFAAVTAGIELIQIREKRLAASVLYQLTEQAVESARGTSSRLLINDRADIAAAAGADGVHLTTQSIDAHTIRRTFGENFLIAASTHSAAEARTARDAGADFVVFGPVFATASKENYGPPAGVAELARVARDLKAFPVLALGGLTTQNAQECLDAGASGIAGISIFNQSTRLANVVATFRR